MEGILARYEGEIKVANTTIKSLHEQQCLPKVVVIVGKYLLGGDFINWCHDLLRDFCPVCMAININKWN